MRYCSHCAGDIVYKVPKDDTRERAVCSRCDTIFYVNPRIIAGCLVHRDDEVLLCRRAIEPRYGKWTLPAGFMENGETTCSAAVRETWEEAGADVSPSHLFTMIDAPFINQVHVFYLASMASPEFAAGVESLEVAFFKLDAIPYDDLAFQTTRITLSLFQQDLAEGNLSQFHELSVLPQHYIPKKSSSH